MAAESRVQEERDRRWSLGGQQAGQRPGAAATRRPGGVRQANTAVLGEKRR
jgi:hypothetical protein